MTPLDLLIVVIYLITLVYVGYRAIGNMEDWATVLLDEGALKEQLTINGQPSAIALAVPLQGQYQFNKINDLAQTLTNNSPIPIYVDWDRSTLTDFKGRSRRVIRLNPSMIMDLSRSQVFSVVAPGQALSERIVAEDMLKRTPEGTLQVAAPIVDLSAARGLAPDGKLEFSLRLLIRLIDTGSETDSDMATKALLCKFIVRRVPWDRDMPWKRK